MSMRYQAGIVLPGYNALLVANAPTIGTATAGSSCCASITFTAPSCTGGSVISTYTAYCTTTGTKTVTGASSPLTVTGLTTGTSYTFKVIATNIYGPSYPSAASNSITAVSAGSQSYTTAGTYSWVAPSGVTSVSVVAIGGGGGGGYIASSGGSGGGLGYKNNYAVTPGNSYTVVVGAGGSGGNPCGSCGNDSYFISTAVVKGGKGLKGIVSAISNGGTYTGDGGGNGGYGNYGPGGYGSGGGGAGGYAGTGGNGGAGAYPGPGNGTAGSGGGGGGGGGGGYTGGACYPSGGGGGGVGLFGQGSNGTAGTGGNVNPTGGGGGSGGANGGCYSIPNGVAGGAYGGGGSNGGYNSSFGSGGSGTRGAVRIVWPGNTRQFPSTNVGSP